MGTNIEKLKEDVKKLLSKEALDLWEAIEWDKEEVGNSKIGFLSIDPNTRTERIAKFINKRASWNKSSVLTEWETWLEQIRQKYYGKDLPLIEINKYRDEIVKRYGSKIIPGLSKKLTKDEVEASGTYLALTSILHTADSRIKIIDAIEYNLYKTRYFLLDLFNQAKRAFWAILLILILLAVIKYLLT